MEPVEGDRVQCWERWGVSLLWRADYKLQFITFWIFEFLPTAVYLGYVVSILYFHISNNLIPRRVLTGPLSDPLSVIMWSVSVYVCNCNYVQLESVYNYKPRQTLHHREEVISASKQLSSSVLLTDTLLLLLIGAFKNAGANAWLITRNWCKLFLMFIFDIRRSGL